MYWVWFLLFRHLHCPHAETLGFYLRGRKYFVRKSLNWLFVLLVFVCAAFMHEHLRLALNGFAVSFYLITSHCCSGPQMARQTANGKCEQLLHGKTATRFDVKLSSRKTEIGANSVAYSRRKKADLTSNYLNFRRNLERFTQSAYPAPLHCLPTSYPL